MSRVGKQPITLPEGVEVEIGPRQLRVKGPKGELTTPVPPGIRFVLDGDSLRAERSADDRQARAYHGLARALAANAVRGVSEGFTVSLVIEGVGYRASLEDRGLKLQVGYSQPVVYRVPDGVAVTVEDQTRIRVTGIDKQKVGEVAAQIRRIRPPNVYSGKGIRYEGEVVRRKAGKASVGAL